MTQKLSVSLLSPKKKKDMRKKRKRGNLRKSILMKKKLIVLKIVLCLLLRKEQPICLFGVRGINQILTQQNSDASSKNKGINSKIPHVGALAPTYAEMTYNHNQVPIMPCNITLKIAARLTCPNWVRAPSYPKLRCGYETTVGSVSTTAAVTTLPA